MVLDLRVAALIGEGGVDLVRRMAPPVLAIPTGRVGGGGAVEARCCYGMRRWPRLAASRSPLLCCGPPSADLGAAPPGRQIWHMRVGGGCPRTGETPGRPPVDPDDGGAPVSISLLRACRASSSPPSSSPMIPGESLGLAGRTAVALWRLGPPWRRRSREGEVVVSRQGAWWRRRCSALRDGGYGGDEVAPCNPSAALHLVRLWATGRWTASACCGMVQT